MRHNDDEDFDEDFSYNPDGKDPAQEAKVKELAAKVFLMATTKDHRQEHMGDLARTVVEFNRASMELGKDGLYVPIQVTVEGKRAEVPAFVLVGMVAVTIKDMLAQTASGVFDPVRGVFNKPNGIKTDPWGRRSWA